MKVIVGKETEEQLIVTSDKTQVYGLTTGRRFVRKKIVELDEQQKFDEYQHKRPDRTDYKTVLVDKHLSLQEKYHSYAENLQAGAESSAEVMKDWMDSPSHKKNILDNEQKIFSKLGVGYNYNEETGHDYWTQLFADSVRVQETISSDICQFPHKPQLQHLQSIKLKT